MEIRPVSDLRNKFTEIEGIVKTNTPVFLTKNGYGTMVVLSLEAYTRLTNRIELALDEADYMAEHESERLSHDEVFGTLRDKLERK